jgi:extracellular matrix regulatory protein A
MAKDVSRELVNVGFGNMVVASRIVAVLGPKSAPIKRLKENAKNLQKLIDATQGRRSRSIVIMDSDHIVLSPVKQTTLTQRIQRVKTSGRTQETPGVGEDH